MLFPVFGGTEKMNRTINRAIDRAIDRVIDRAAMGKLLQTAYCPYFQNSMY